MLAEAVFEDIVAFYGRRGEADYPAAARLGAVIHAHEEPRGQEVERDAKPREQDERADAHERNARIVAILEARSTACSCCGASV